MIGQTDIQMELIHTLQTNKQRCPQSRVLCLNSANAFPPYIIGSLPKLDRMALDLGDICSRMFFAVTRVTISRASIYFTYKRKAGKSLDLPESSELILRMETRNCVPQVYCICVV